MSAERKALAKSVAAVFLIPPAFESVAGQIISLSTSLSSTYQSIALAFLDNLHGVLRTLSIPFEYTHAQVHSLHFQRFTMAERIRALTLDNEEDREKVAREKAEERFQSFLRDEKGGAIAQEVLERLASLAGNSESLAAARELTRQGIVLIWSAFEVLARDAFVLCLNKNPLMADRLLAHPASRKRFIVEKLDWSTLSGYAFDLSGSLGTLLSQRADLDDVLTIRDAYGGLFPDAAELRLRLADDRLWRLFQNRNLIVHRRGIVDRRYMETTGDAVPLGSPLWIAPADVEDTLLSVVAAGETLITEVSNAG